MTVSGDVSFALMATVPASTKRSPAAVGGKTGAPVAHLSNLLILPLMPIDPETAQTLPLNSPREAKTTFVETALDIREGDYLTISAVDYVIRAVGEWNGADADFVQVFVEVLK